MAPAPPPWLQAGRCPTVRQPARGEGSRNMLCPVSAFIGRRGLVRAGKGESADWRWSSATRAYRTDVNCRAASQARGVSSRRAQLIWNFVALNSTPSIALHKETEVALGPWALDSIMAALASS